MDASDLDADPIRQLARWLDDVQSSGSPEPTAMALATAGADARPTVRHVLLKQLDERGLVWFTNYESRKGRELAENPYAAVVFPWFGMVPSRQVIVRGSVAKIDAGESDAYFATRPRDSQLSAWASEQGREIPDRDWLEASFAEAAARFEGVDVPRPPHWGGYRLRPDEFEFWQGRANRMHDRIAYHPDPDVPTGWRRVRLSP